MDLILGKQNVVYPPPIARQAPRAYDFYAALVHTRRAAVKVGVSAPPESQSLSLAPRAAAIQRCHRLSDHAAAELSAVSVRLLDFALYFKVTGA
jgi:hypothetical protein